MVFLISLANRGPLSSLSISPLLNSGITQMLNAMSDGLLFYLEGLSLRACVFARLGKCKCVFVFLFYFVPDFFVLALWDILQNFLLGLVILWFFVFF